MGVLLLLRWTHYPEQGYAKSLEGLIKKVVGHKNDPGMDIMSINRSPWHSYRFS